jgi:arylsulfatase A-like enzyme
MKRQPNFLFLFPDQWRGDCLGSLGHPVVKTPVLDALSNDGVTFTQAYSACPSCIAARASVVTGQTPSTHGRLGFLNGVPWRYKNIMMRCLRDEGNYQTLCAGKTHFWPKRDGLGFEEMRLHDTRHNDPDFVSEYWPWLKEKSNGSIRDLVDVGGHWNDHDVVPWEHPEELHPSTWTAERALELLDKKDPNRPFFMQVSFFAPHTPLNPPMKYLDLYRNVNMDSLPIGEWSRRKFPQPVMEYDQKRSDESAYSDMARKAYYAHITHLDILMGRVINWLKKNNEIENTYIIFTSDHGDMMGDHNQYAKVCPYRGSVMIPFIVVPPKSMVCKSGITSDKLISLTDIMPSVLDAAGIDIPDTVEGLNFNPLLRNKAVKWRDYIHMEHAWGNYSWEAIVNHREKFIWYTVSGDKEYFDLETDPMETVNLINAPDYASRVNACHNQLVEILSKRPQDGMTDGKRLIAGKALPHVRQELLP